MPFVRIDLNKKHPEGFAQQVGDIIYGVMREHINVPADDKFQVITRHDGNELVTPKSYLGIEYSEEIIFIQVTLNEGRTTERRKSFTRLSAMVWLKN
jgi:4-oxalocrotonate tautomerase